MLLLWISFIIIIPFDLSRLDGSLQGQPSMVDQILSIAKVWSVTQCVCVRACACMCVCDITPPFHQCCRVILTNLIRPKTLQVTYWPGNH